MINVSKRQEIILTWTREYRDQLGGFPRMRPFHCTSVGLTPAITPNVGDSGSLFISVGSAFALTPANSMKNNHSAQALRAFRAESLNRPKFLGEKLASSSLSWLQGIFRTLTGFFIQHLFTCCPIWMDSHPN